MQDLEQQIEAIIFSSDKPVSFSDILETLNKRHDTFFETSTVQEVLDSLLQKYQEDKYAFEMVETGGGYQFLTKPAHHEIISVFLQQKTKKRLSTAAMETLAIIAYKQPVAKSEVEQIRGVNCDYTIAKLLEKELIQIMGRDDSLGKPILYGTSDSFMDYFGINSVDELPKPKDLQPEQNEIGEKE